MYVHICMYLYTVFRSVQEGLSVQMDLFCLKETEKTVQAVAVCSRTHGGAINNKRIVTRFKGGSAMLSFIMVLCGQMECREARVCMGRPIGACDSIQERVLAEIRWQPWRWEEESRYDVYSGDE